MFETPLTVVGNIVNEPIRRRVGDQELIKLRVASNSRRRTADGGWETVNSLFVNVNCWGRLVTGVGASLIKGSAVIAVGHAYTSEYDDRDGVRRSMLEMRATSVGPDLARCTARIEKLVPAGPDVPVAAAPEPVAADSDRAGHDADVADTDDELPDDEPQDDEGLALSA
ncbi:MAG TPA: single-stranded DNA-binding protein [Mycobacterium sp.]|nr:single-stranded DNA-binding protein [Mycobacterium sp.]